jgi:DNA-binding CsgD family transcriptional regulator
MLLPIAVRALADRIQGRRDHGTDPAAELARLRTLRERHPKVTEEFDTGGLFLRRQEAMQHLADAETARARSDPDETARWRQAAEACRTAEIPWDEAYCRWRVAQSALRGRTDRPQAGAALRRAHELAVDLQASWLLAEIDVLARNAHLATQTGADPPPSAVAMPGLTAREREVLTHLAAGETYREIAHALVLSEKTISAHVSNMLRKTGTRSRVDLVDLARRRTSKGSGPDI